MLCICGAFMCFFDGPKVLTVLIIVNYLLSPLISDKDLALLVFISNYACPVGKKYNLSSSNLYG